MPTGHIQSNIGAIARKWQDLAERRLAYFIELYRSGRWQHYYSEEKFTIRMREVIENVKQWRDLAVAVPQKPEASTGTENDGELRPAA